MRSYSVYVTSGTYLVSHTNDETNAVITTVSEVLDVNLQETVQQ